MSRPRDIYDDIRDVQDEYTNELALLGLNGGNVNKFTCNEFNYNDANQHTPSGLKAKLSATQHALSVVRELASFTQTLNYLPQLLVRFPNLQDDLKLLVNSHQSSSASSTIFKDDGKQVLSAVAKINLAHVYDEAIELFYRQCEDLSRAVIERGSKKDAQVLVSIMEKAKVFVANPSDPVAVAGMISAMKDINKRVNVVKRAVGRHFPADEEDLKKKWNSLNRAAKVMVGVGILIVSLYCIIFPPAMLVALAFKVLADPTKVERAMMQTERSANALLDKAEKFLSESAAPKMVNAK